MATFPTTITYVKTSGFKEEFPESITFLGGSSFVYDPIVDIELRITNDSDFKDFLDWYISDISYGSTNFTITMPFFGVNRAWDVKICNKPISSSSDVWDMRNIPLKLRVLDDISTYVA